MEMRSLGSSGIVVSRLGLGCATFGREIDEASSFQIMDAALERGMTLFDTGRVLRWRAGTPVSTRPVGC